MIESAPQIEHLTTRARDFAVAGRFSAARAMLAALRRQSNYSHIEPTLDEIEAMVSLGEDRAAEARAALDRAITAKPGDATLHLLRADARARLSDLPGAAHDASEAVILRPDDPAPKAMLGLVLLELGQTADARACLSEAVAGAPGIPSHWLGLAHALAQGGEDQAAAEALDAGIAAVPGYPGLRAAAMRRALLAGDFARAAALGEAARADGVADATIFALLGNALGELGRQTAAAEAYREALKLAPEDEALHHIVRAAEMDAGAHA